MADVLALRQALCRRFEGVDEAFVAAAVDIALQRPDVHALHGRGGAAAGGRQQPRTEHYLLTTLSIKLQALGGALPKQQPAATDAGARLTEEEYAQQALELMLSVAPDAELDALRRVLGATPNYSAEHALGIWFDLSSTPAPQQKQKNTAQQQQPQQLQRPRRLWPRGVGLAAHERMRTERYKRAVLEQLQLDYPLLYKASIRGVLAEHNYDYALAFLTLRQVEARFRKQVMGKIFQFFGYQASSSASGTKSAVNPLLRDDIDRLRRALADELAVQDRAVAEKYNEAEYRDDHQFIECSCCYGDFTFESLVACRDGHLFCTVCVDKQCKAILYENAGFKPLVCFSADGCQEEFTWQALQVALSPADFDLYVLRTQKKEAIDAKLDLVGCPFCDYVAVNGDDDDDGGKLITSQFERLGRMLLMLNIASTSLVALVAVVFHISFVTAVPFVIFVAIVSALFVFGPVVMLALPLPDLPDRKAREFECGNPACLRVSCRNCKSDAHAPNPCAATVADGVLTVNEVPTWETMRKAVEQAMAEALVRTCPQCGLQFYKTEGCNKMVCVCGYKMCYICRQDVREEQYKHFCQHARFPPGTPCRTCDKCELFKQDDADELVKQAGTRAKQAFLQRYPQMRKYARRPIGPVV